MKADHKDSMGGKKENDEKKSKRIRSDSPIKKQSRRMAKLNELEKEVEKLAIELNDVKDKYVRTLADFDNYRKRKDREVMEIIERANEQFFIELLPVIDDLERSLNSEVKRKSYKSLKQGIELIYQKLIAALKKQGLEAIDSMGQPFNPELHEAIMQAEDRTKPANAIIGEAVKGYRLKNKILRYSQVVVNK